MTCFVFVAMSAFKYCLLDSNAILGDREGGKKVEKFKLKMECITCHIYIRNHVWS